MKKSLLGMGILAFVIGLMMLIAPQEVVKVAVIVIGSAAIINGIFNLVKVRKLVADASFEKLITTRGIISIIIGAIAIVFPILFAETIWTVMIYMLAVYLLVSAGLELYGATKLRAAGISTKMFNTEIGISIITAIILFLIPATIGKVIIRILGLVIILAALGYLYWEWKNKPEYVYSEEIEGEEPNETDTTKTN